MVGSNLLVSKRKLFGERPEAMQTSFYAMPNRSSGCFSQPFGHLFDRTCVVFRINCE